MRRETCCPCADSLGKGGWAGLAWVRVEGGVCGGGKPRGPLGLFSSQFGTLAAVSLRRGGQGVSLLAAGLPPTGTLVAAGP